MATQPILFGLNNYYYHASIRKYVALFGSLFTELYIQRKNGTKTESIKVPLKYGPGNAYDNAKQDDTRQYTKVRQILPAMAFEMTDIQKDANRLLSSMQTINQQVATGATSGNFQMNRVPYNFTFELVIRTKSVDDMLQIVEQIIPAFNPNITVTIQDLNVNEIDVTQAITVSLDSVQQQDNYEEMEESRIIQWTLGFTLKGFLYKKTQSDYVIKEVDISYYVDQFGLWDPAQDALDGTDVIKPQ